MKDDDIESLIAFDLCERHPEDDDWRRVAMGERDPAVLVAERRDEEAEDELERKRALFSPPSDDAHARMRDALRDRFYSATSSSGEVPSVADTDVVPMTEARRRRARGTRFASAAWGGLMAAAAALALVWLVDRTDESTDAEPLASYEVRHFDTWSGSMRSASAGAPESERCEVAYHRDRSITVRLLPRAETKERVAVATMALSETGESKWWPPAAPEQGADGVLTIRRSVAEVGLDSGAWTLTFFVSRGGEHFSREELQGLEPGTHPGVTVIQTTVCIEG